jgi:excisionase family DNA binding protein
MRNVSEKLAYTIPEAAAASGVGRTMLYELIKRGELPLVKIGARSLIRRQDLEAMLERKLRRNDG